jgi:photosystem II stability/assembly factor-like uncharacterized protein
MASTSSRRFLFLLLLALLVSAVPMTAGAAVDGSWNNLGPDGGSVYSLAFQPDNPQVMYAGVDGGAYKSVDGGATWAWAGQGLDFVSPVSSLAIDPVRTSTVYAAQGQGAYRSLDGGVTWTRTGPPGAFVVAAHPGTSGTVFAGSVLGLYRTVNGGAIWKRLTRRLPRQYRATSVLFDPAAPNRIYAVIEDIDTLRGRVFRSTDGGTSWQPANGGLEQQAVSALAIAPQSPQTLYAGTSDAVYKSTNGGASWRRTGLTDIGLVRALAVRPDQSDVVYAGTAAGLFRSQDGGETWTPLSQGLPDRGTLTVLAFFPSSPQSLFAGVFTYVRRGGVFKSTDEGTSWTLSSHGLSALNVQSLAVDPQTRGTLWVAANFTLFKSTDRGATWSRVRPDPAAGDLLISRVFSDPLDSATVYVLLNTSELRRTRDGGQTWEILGNPLVITNKIVIDPQTPSTLYAIGLGIAKSTDRGATWTPLSGMPARLYVYDLAISPSSPSTLYVSGAAGNIQQILRTTDGGVTWTPIQGLASTISLAIDPLIPTTAYTVFGGNIYKTRDGDNNAWIRVSNAFRNQTVHPLAASPFPAGLLYGAVWGNNVYESADGGAHWSPLGEGPTRSAFTALAVDPLDPCRIYAGTLNRGLLAFTKTGTAECN